MSESEVNASSTQTRQAPWCWECQRRRLVCDKTKPVCNKCRIAGIVCPGYGDKKPLTWLAPGKVKSRERKRKPSPKSNGEASKSLVSRTKGNSDAGAQNVQLIKQPEFNPESRQTLEAADYCKSSLQGPSRALRYLLTIDAADNDQVYPMFLSTQLGPTPFIAPVIVPLFRHLPAAAIRIMVSMALRHRVLQLPQDTDQTSKSELWSRSFRYHDLSIKGLNEALSNEATRDSDFTISTVGLFLVAEQSASTNWRYHLDGLTTLVSLRGGWQNLVRSAPYLQPQLLTCIFVEVVGDTTSPALEKTATTTHLEMVDQMSDLYSIGYFPSFPCPFPLFTKVIQINQLRSQIMTSMPISNEFEHTGRAVLDAVLAFSSEEWSEAKTAIALYCIAALQSFFTFPASPELMMTRNEEAGRLLELLQQAAKSPYVKNSLIWPLVVLGAIKTGDDNAAQGFVGKELCRLSVSMGTALPTTAKRILEEFWKSSKTSWDECFDQPYCFLT